MRFRERLAKDVETYKKIPTKSRKVAFVFEYYGAMIATALLIFVVGISSIVRAAAREQVVLYTVLLNSDELVRECDEEIFKNIMVEANIDMTKKRVDVNTDLYIGMDGNEEQDITSMQVLTALFTISDLDVFVSDEEHYEIYAKEKAFANLEELLGDENLCYYYYDGEPVGIILNNDSLLHQAGYYHDRVIIGIANNAANMENAKLFIKSLVK